MEDIDSLIFGDFSTEIMDMKIPLWAPCELVARDALDGAYVLFNGFLVFLMYRQGYKLKLDDEFDSKADFDDRSWWINNLGDPALIGRMMSPSIHDGEQVPPYVFREFENDKGEQVTICILLDWFSFYECGLVFAKLTKDEKSNLDLEYVTREFQLQSDKENFIKVFTYFQALSDVDFASSHKLVLRSDMLAEHPTNLHEDYRFFDDFPENLIRKKEWDKMELAKRISTLGKSELIFCNKDNFQDLLKKVNICIPNVDFISFNEFIKNRITLVDEWKDIRNRYISKLKKELKEPFLSNDYLLAVRFIQKARASFDEKNYQMSLMFSANTIESALGEYLKRPNINFNEQINKLQETPMQKHVSELHYVRKKRNEIVHPTDVEINENTAKVVLDMADAFLADLKNAI